MTDARDKGGFQDARAARHRNRAMDPRVVRTIDYLRNDPRRTEIATLARRVGLGRSQLEHLFKRDTGISIRRYVTERRLQAAAARLRTSDERVSEIAWRVGYTDASNFNHAFTKRFGVSPTDYRRSTAALTGDRALARGARPAPTAQMTNTLQIEPRDRDCGPDAAEQS